MQNYRIAPVTIRPAGDYVGKYFHRAFGEIRVFLNGTDKLSLTFGRYGFVNISPKSETVFLGWYYGPLWFVTASDDSFTPMTLEFVKSDTSAIVGLIFPVDEVYNDTYFHKDRPVDIDVSYKISDVCAGSPATEQFTTLHRLILVCLVTKAVIL